MARYLGFDTSNYTTSVAIYDTQCNLIKNSGRILPVPEGKLGLRQSDAVFAHVKALPDIVKKLLEEYKDITAIGVSTRPRNVEGSYMPCFMVGETTAKVLASVLHVPCYSFSHQEGHLAAVLYSEHKEVYLNKPFLAWHLSGGTTELLYVTPDLHILKVGGTLDISAGQLIDRTGVLLGLPFPAGQALDKMAVPMQGFTIKQKGLEFSLSGMENKMRQMHETISDASLAGFVLASIADILVRITKSAFEVYEKCPVIVSGGVAGSQIIRQAMSRFNAVFAAPAFSSDNALGIAALAARAHEKEIRT